MGPVADRLLVITDTHLRGNILDTQLSVLDRLIEETQPDEILHLGDLGDRGTFGDVDQPASTMVKRFVDFVHGFGLPWTILAGNHDYAGTACSLDFFHSPLVKVVKEPEILEMCGLSIAALPWCHGQSAKAAVKALDGVDMLVGHADLCGYVWAGQEIGADSAFAIHPNWWKHLDCVVEFGHIHHSDKYFLGAVWPKNFGEKGHPGTYGLWEGGSYSRHEIPKSYRIRYREMNAEKAQRLAAKKQAGTQFWKISHTGQRPKIDFPENVNPVFVREVVKRERKSRRPQEWAAMGWHEQVDAFVEDTGADYSPDALAEVKGRYVMLHDPGTNAVRLDSMHVKHYGWVDDASITFGDFTAILGPNGSGKSTFLSALATAAYGSPPDGRLVGDLTNNRTSITATLSGITHCRKWFGEKYSVDGHAVNDQSWKEMLPLPSKQVFFATQYISQERQSDLMREDGVYRLKVLSEMVGCTFGDIAAEFAPKEPVKEIRRVLAEVEDRLEAATQERKEMERQISQDQAAYEKEVAALAASNKAAEKKNRLEDEADRIGEELEADEAEIRREATKYENLLQDYMQRLEVFTARAKKAGCAANPIPCPLLKAPDPVERPEVYTVWKELKTADPMLLTTLKCYPLLSKDMQKRWQHRLKLIGRRNSILAEIATMPKADVSVRTVNIYRGALDAAKARHKRIVDQAITLESKLDRCWTALRRAEVMEECCKFFGPNGIQKWWLETRLEAISDKANEYLGEVERPMSVRFLSGEGKSPRIDVLVEIDGVEREVRALSGGEKTMVSLALWCAFGSSFLLLDEPFGWLHPSVIPDACRVLQRASADRQIVVITHEPLVANYADVIVRF